MGETHREPLKWKGMIEIEHEIKSIGAETNAGTALAMERAAMKCLRPTIEVLAAFIALWIVDARGATLTAASASYADVNSAVSSAGRNDTVIVPNGTVTWASTLRLTKGISLIAPGGYTGVVITKGSGAIIDVAPDSTAIANEETIRIVGFTFNGNNSSKNLISIEGPSDSVTKPFKNLAIGFCRFENTSTTDSGNGAIWNTTGQTRGCIYSNIFDRVEIVLKIMGSDTWSEWALQHYPQSYGTADQLFFEGNTIMYSSSYTGGDDTPGWTETGQGGRLVVRYNTWNYANANPSEVWDIHGFQYNSGGSPDSGETGTMCSEYYGNTVINFNSGYRLMHIRSPWLLHFNNTCTGNNSPDNEWGEYQGSCWADLGSPATYNPEITNVYCWNNPVNGTDSPLVYDGADNYCGVSENRNWYNYNASFNGTTGIGRGTAAPTMNCTKGVAYWQASTATPTVDPAVVQNGILWKATAANTWTAYYTPYTFPHPLAGGTTPPETNPPSITSDLTDQTVGTNTTATFSVTATGDGTLTYQWNWVGTNVTGATASSWTTPTTTLAMSNTAVYVGVTNAYGGVVSSTKHLYVTNGSSSGGVYYVSTSGNANNPGTLASPWTLAKANSTLTAGQTAYLRGGSYVTGISPAHSGTAGNPVVFQNYAGETPTIAGNLTGITLDTKSWVTVSGILCTNVTMFASLSSTTNCTLTNCTFAYQNGTANWSGIAINYSAQSNLVVNCIGHHWGSATVNPPTGDLIYIGGETATDYSYYNRFENCQFYASGHSLFEVSAGYNIFRGNYLHNEAWSGGYGHRCMILDGQVAGPAVGHNLIESNRIAYAAASIDDGTHTGIDLRASYNIIRRNLFYNNSSCGISLAGGSGVTEVGCWNHVYNNVFYTNNLLSDANSIDGAIGFQVYGSPFVVKTNSFYNNIFYRNLAAFAYAGGVNASDQIFSNNLAQTANPIFKDVTSAYTPTKLNLPDLSILSNSPCVDAGCFLTRTTSSGNGTSLPVADAAFFFSGYGMIPGDTIQLQGGTATATITGISGKTLTLNSSLTWTDGQGVSLPYSGAAPDMGAYEYGSGAGQETYPLPPTGLHFVGP